MKRRANGEGTVRQRKDGRWEVQVVLPSGERKSIYAKSQRVVLEKKKAELERAAAGMPAGAERQTVGEFLATGLEGARTRVRLSTWTRYEIFVRKDILPELGRIRLAQLTPAHVKQLEGKLIAAGKSPTSVRHMQALLWKAFDEATKWGVVARNIVALVEPPDAAPFEAHALTDEQVRALLDAAAVDRLEALYVVAVTTGMREGELFGLRWRDVDLENQMLQVRQTVSWAGGKATFGQPKTKRSRRRVELTALAIAALKEHRRRQNAERLASAGGWEDLDLVFANEVGRPLQPTNLTARSYRPLLRRAGLPQIRFHDLRHTAATTLLGHSVPTKIVSEMLGHSSTAITDDIYSHVTPTMTRVAASVMDAAIGGARVSMRGRDTPPREPRKGRKGKQREQAVPRPSSEVDWRPHRGSEQGLCAEWLAALAGDRGPRCQERRRDLRRDPRARCVGDVRGRPGKSGRPLTAVLTVVARNASACTQTEGKD